MISKTNPAFLISNKVKHNLEINIKLIRSIDLQQILKNQETNLHKGKNLKRVLIQEERVTIVIMQTQEIKGQFHQLNLLIN